MKYVILRDDDTSAVTPIDCLEQLYRPFLERHLPVNLAVIPLVNLQAKLPGGGREYFLEFAKASQEQYAPIGGNATLVRYLLDNQGYTLAQHGCHHDVHEFLNPDGEHIAKLLQLGTAALHEAGLGKLNTFVAPQDKLSAAAFKVVAQHFPIISTGWFERDRLPLSWWPKYLLSKLRRREHWRINGCLLLSRPGSYLSRLYRPEIILEQLKSSITEHTLTVINTHWWEFFPQGQPDIPYIQALHQLADYLANAKDIQVLSFNNLIDGTNPSI